MSKRRKIIIVLVAFLGIVLVGLGIHLNWLSQANRTWRLSC